MFIIEKSGKYKYAKEEEIEILLSRNDFLLHLGVFLLRCLNLHIYFIFVNIFIQ